MPVVVHVRSVVRNDAKSLRTRLINWMLRDKANAIIAIDENVRASLPAGSAGRCHSQFIVAGSPTGVADRSFADRLKFRPESFKVGFVGNLLRVKGIFELIEAARLTRDRGLDVEFIIVGG